MIENQDLLNYKDLKNLVIMKYLFLLRHGHAPRAMNESDADRKLSALGYKEAEQVGDFLNKKELKIELIKSSDSIRTKQTVAKLLEVYSSSVKTTFLRELYNVSSYEVLEEIKNTENSISSLMMVGHNPGITAILDLLNPTGTSEQVFMSRNYEITCKLVVIKIDIKKWNDIDFSPSKINAVFYPELRSPL